MCIDCTRRYVESSPVRQITEHMTETARLIQEWYGHDGNGAGGMLHVALDDFNLEDHHLEWHEQDADRSDPLWPEAEVILDRLGDLTIGERAIVVAVAHGEPLAGLLTEA